MKRLAYVLILSLVLSINAYADDVKNYYNAPQGGDNGGMVAMERLRSTELELERAKRDRVIAITEMNYRIEKDESRWSPVVWTIIGIAAGGAAGYFGAKAVSK